MSDFVQNSVALTDDTIYHGKIDDAMMMWPIPGGFVNSYMQGYKSDITFLAHSDYSPILKMRWSQACRAWNAGKIEKGLRIDQLFSYWKKEKLSDIPTDNIRGYFTTFANLMQDWIKHDGEAFVNHYSMACPIRQWIGFLRGSDEAPGVMEAYRMERLKNPSRSSLYQPETWLGPMQAKKDQLSMDPYYYPHHHCRSVSEIKITNQWVPPPRPVYDKSAGQYNSTRTISEGGQKGAFYEPVMPQSSRSFGGMGTPHQQPQQHQQQTFSKLQTGPMTQPSEPQAQQPQSQTCATVSHHQNPEPLRAPLSSVAHPQHQPSQQQSFTATTETKSADMGSSSMGTGIGFKRGLRWNTFKDKENAEPETKRLRRASWSDFK